MPGGKWNGEYIIADLNDFSGLHCLNVIADKYKKQDKRLVVKHLPASALRMIAKADGLATFEVADPSTVVVEMAGGAAGATGAVAPGTRVKTYMGPGTVQRTKKDGVTCVIELEWDGPCGQASARGRSRAFWTDEERA